MQRFQTPQQAAQWLRQHVRGTLHTDSRQLAAGDGFIAWPGAHTDARAHVRQALERGIAACLVEHDGVDGFAFDDARVASLPGLRDASALVADTFCEHPSHDLDVLAVTGTNGKTSTVWWLAQALSGTHLATPRRCAMVGTLGLGFPPAASADPVLDSLRATGLTTPDGVLLQTSLRSFAAAGARACAIEASSIGIESHRLDGVRIHTAIFTNLTQDHLDYHGDMANYWRSKERLFHWPGLRAAVVNIDDPKGRQLAATLAADTLDLWTVSRESPARLHATDLQDTASGMRFTVVEGTAQQVLNTHLIGHYNVSNLLGVLGALRSLGVPLDQSVAACADLMPVPGRLQCVQLAGQPMGVVDYAHTPDALEKSLAALRPLARQRGGALWCVFGCGGERDPAKRPMMGAAAAAGADHVVLTSDNPRREDPAAILKQITPGLAGHASVTQIENRSQAIAHALQGARSADVVLVAGKGHETYQEAGGNRLPFSDMAEVHKGLALRQTGNTTESGDGSMMTLAHALHCIPGAVAVGDTSVQIMRVHTDTRSLQPGDLFVALKGERFDANQFLAQAKASGAVAVICHPGSGLTASGLPGLEVPDTKVALGLLAGAWRAQFVLPLIAVTGSNGKTTVTQMLASILRAWKGGASLATLGNFNNDIGVPLTLLRLRPGHRVAALELGMNRPGEIAHLAAMARPSVALVNNAQREHLEFMSTVEAVAHENGAVITALPSHGTVVIPHDDAFSGLWRSLAGPRRQWSFALQPASASAEAGSPDVVGTSATWSGHAWTVQASTPAGTLQFRLRIAGLHNVRNSLAAVTCALAAGVPLKNIVRGLESFEPVKGRSRAMEITMGQATITLIDDSYNANPDSVNAALDLLATLPAPRLMVLGDMGEVGHQGALFHAQAGTLAHELGIERLFTHGPLSSAAAGQAAGARHFYDMPALIAAVLEELPGTASVLVKGSRFMRMERVVEAITHHAQDHQAHKHAA